MQSHSLRQGVESVIWECVNNKKDGCKLRISHCPGSYRTRETQTGHCGDLEGDYDPGWMESERLCGKKRLALYKLFDVKDGRWAASVCNHVQASVTLIISVILTDNRECLWHLYLNSFKGNSQVNMKLLASSHMDGKSKWMDAHKRSTTWIHKWSQKMTKCLTLISWSVL